MHSDPHYPVYACHENTASYAQNYHPRLPNYASKMALLRVLMQPAERTYKFIVVVVQYKNDESQSNEIHFWASDASILTVISRAS